MIKYYVFVHHVLPDSQTVHDGVTFLGIFDHRPIRYHLQLVVHL